MCAATGSSMYWSRPVWYRQYSTAIHPCCRVRLLIGCMIKNDFANGGTFRVRSHRSKQFGGYAFRKGPWGDGQAGLRGGKLKGSQMNGCSILPWVSRLPGFGTDLIRVTADFSFTCFCVGDKTRVSTCSPPFLSGFLCSPSFVRWL